MATILSLLAVVIGLGSLACWSMLDYGFDKII